MKPSLSITQAGTPAIIDSSKAIIVGPKAYVNPINEAIGCVVERTTTRRICKLDCSKVSSLPDVTFVISGKNFNISSEYYIQQNSTSEMIGLKLVTVLFAVATITHAAELQRVPLYKLVHVFINTQYAGITKIGNQNFLTVFDSTSCNVVVASQECVGGACVCPNLQKYEKLKPKYISDGNVQVKFFDTGSAVGRGIEDSLTVRNFMSLSQIFYVKIGDTTVAPAGTQAIIDTSKAIIVGPKAYVNPINEAIGCVVEKTTTRRICKGNLCYSGFQPCGHSDHFFIGDFFVDHYYSEFNWENKTMGFGRSVESV
ncbi:Aspartic protease Bla g 2 [Blattella germanica]|nr:Aspartic protease Bla g 2 [Blattella germanica]